jgi:threonine dehydrogenase-like Zn-dependent dehydrogenase
MCAPLRVPHPDPGSGVRDHPTQRPQQRVRSFRSLTLRTGQCHVQRYMRPLLERIERGELNPTRIITHRLPLAEAPRGYDMFKNKEDGCEKVVLKP